MGSESNGPNARPRDETIAQTGAGLPDDTGAPRPDSGPESEAAARRSLGAPDPSGPQGPGGFPGEGGTYVRDLMTPSPEMIEPEASLHEAARQMRDADVGALPVGANGRIVGILTDRDITVRAVALGRGPGECTVGEVMSEGSHVCHADDHAGRAADVMAERRVRRLAVLDGDGRVIGMIALADLARAGLGGPALARVSEPAGAPRD